MKTRGVATLGFSEKFSGFPKPLHIRRIASLKDIFLASSLLAFSFSLGCAQTEIIESPKTTYVADTGTAKDPLLIWTSRTVDRPFDYLGQIKARAWTYDGALERLKEAGRELRADAVIDIHFERLGFFKTMHAFAIKFKE